jgi:hypothetical protein
MIERNPLKTKSREKSRREAVNHLKRAKTVREELDAIKQYLGLK